MVRLSVILLLFAGAARPALSDDGAAGWSLGLSCPPKGRYGAGALTMSRSGGFGAAGTCARTPGLFTKISVTTSGGGTLRSSTAYAIHTPSVLIVPPMLTTEVQPIFLVTGACPAAAGATTLNWMFVQWDTSGAYELDGTYTFGTATYNGGINITGQYGLNGALYYAGNTPMPGSCNATNGVYSVSVGEADATGSVYFTASGMGVFKTNTGRATFFFPARTAAPAADLGNRTLRGMTFDSSSHDDVADVRNVIAVADALGTTITVQPLSDPENGVVDTGGTAYTDTISLTAVNNPTAGFLRGTVTRASVGTGDIVCMLNVSDGDTLLFCSGRTPGNNDVPYQVSLYAEGVHSRVQGIGGGITSIAREPGGKLYVGGGFTDFGGLTANRLARMNADGTLDSTFDTGTGFDDHVEAVLVDSSTSKVYVAGPFTTYNGVAAAHLVRLNTDGSRDTTFNIGTGFNSTGPVTLAQDASGRLYAGGSFSTYNSGSSTCIVRILSTGARDTLFNVGTGANSNVLSIAIDSATGKVYLGGAFSTYNGVSSTGIARLLSTGARDTTFVVGLGFNSIVEAISFDGTNIYVGGWFDTYAGSSAGKIARLTATGAFDTAFNPGAGFNAAVKALHWDASVGALYVGGPFTLYDGATSAPRLVRLTTTGAIDTGFVYGTGLGQEPSNIVSEGATGRVLVTGGLRSYNGTSIRAIVSLNADGTVYSNLSSSSGFNGSVTASVLSSASREIYASGAFTNFNGTAALGIAKIRSDGAFDPVFAAGVGSGFAGGTPQSLSVDGTTGKIYAGGDFTSYAGTSRNRIVRINTDGTLDTGFAVGTGFNSTVYATAWDATTGKVYVAGGFATYAGGSVGKLVRLNTDGTVDTTFNIGAGFTGGVLRSLAVDPVTGNVYVGGFITTYQGVASSGLVRITTTGARDTTFNVGSGFGGASPAPYNLAWDGTNQKIYASGLFTSYQGTSAAYIVRINANGSRDSGFNVGSGFNAYTTSVSPDPGNGRVWVTGTFASYRGTAVSYLARLNNDGSLDTTLAQGSGLAYWPSTATFDPVTAKIYLGGAFVSYAGTYVDYFVRLTYAGQID